MRIGRPVCARACMSRANPVNATFVAMMSPPRPLMGVRSRSNYNHRILNICILVKTYVHYKGINSGHVEAWEIRNKEDGNAAEPI
jgi:hypothetical protein